MVMCCLKKDIQEVLRTGKLVFFLVLALGIGVLIMGFTVIFSDIPDFLTSELSGFDIGSLEEMMSTLYPKRVRESLGVFSYYIGFFNSLITILVCNGILPRERQSGKWILPKEQGYKGSHFLAGKCIIYGGMAAVSVFISYMLYFFISNTFMEQNMTFGNAIFCGMLHGLNAMFILDYTFLFAVWFNSGVLAAISMIGTVLFIPDIMNYISFGKYLPTYLLSFVYDSSSDYGTVVLPLLVNIIFFAMLYVIAVSKLDDKKVGL